MLHKRLPFVTTDPNKPEEQAKSILEPTAYNYVARCAGERATIDASRLAFRKWKMSPRIIRPTTHRDLTIRNWSCSSPLRSTASSSSIEEVAEANGNGPRWYQLYWPQDEEITKSLLKRAKENGYKVLVVTLDTWALASRPADLDGAYVPFMEGIGNTTGFTDPVFRRKFKEKFNATPEEKLLGASNEWVGDVFSGAAHSWEDISHLKKHWDGPIVLKGIQVA
ncbi:FMN-dependent dehydrogenase-domain-containing protein [Leptodontidium sp. 2 PMI_412]|nr:FMN-dependent dehydrogenase-domain-containing protein [Leptodontidium sp. 2 PMI_412]